jgi:hypothetical protein
MVAHYHQNLQYQHDLEYLLTMSTTIPVPKFPYEEGYKLQYNRPTAYFLGMPVSDIAAIRQLDSTPDM